MTGEFFPYPFDVENTIISIDLPTALRNALLYLVENVNINRASLYIYNDKSKILTSELVYINGTILMGDEEFFISSLNKDDKTASIIKQKIIIKPSYGYIPLYYNEKIYGLLMVDKSLDKKDFNKKEIEFIKKVASIAARGIYQNKILQDRDNKIKQLNALLDISIDLNTRKRKNILQKIAKALIRYGKFDRARIYIRHKVNKFICIASESIFSSHDSVDRKIYTIKDFNKKDITDIYYILILEGDEDLPLGIIEVDNIISQMKFLKEQVNFLKIIGAQLSVTLKNISLMDELKKISITDPLTGVYNHRYLVEYLNKEIKRAKRYNLVFSVMLFDVDNFKQINDRYGHLKGDEVLKKLIKCIKKLSRDIDVLSRYGGDEFLIIAPETDKNNAIKFAQKILNSLPTIIYRDKKDKISISIGVSTFPYDGENIHELIKTADKKLYTAKHAGKHRVSG